jgi:hypothetical protein
VEVVGIQTGEAQTFDNDLDPGETFTVEKTSPRSPQTTTMPSSCRVAP